LLLLAEALEASQRFLLPLAEALEASQASVRKPKQPNCQFYTLASPKCLFLTNPINKNYVFKNSTLLDFASNISK
jgi:hypothetical protein